MFPTRRFLVLLLVGFASCAGWILPISSPAVAGGLAAGDSWESPLFGTIATWDDEWQIEEDAPPAPDGMDYLQLYNGNVVFELYARNASNYESLDDALEEHLRNDAAFYEDFVLRDVYWSTFGDDDETAAGFAYTYIDNNRDWLTLAEMYPAGDTYIVLLLTAPINDVEDAFTSANGGILIDDLEPFGYVWTEDELPTGEEEPVFLDDIFAGEEEVLWTGELHGAEIACSGSWDVDEPFTWVDADVGVESVSINGPNSTFIATFALAENATTDQVMDTHREIMPDQFRWDTLEEIDTGSDGGYGTWAEFSGAINGDAKTMFVETTWYDASADIAVIVQFMGDADSFDTAFSNFYNQCGIDDSYIFSYFTPDE